MWAYDLRVRKKKGRLGIRARNNSRNIGYAYVHGLILLYRLVIGSREDQLVIAKVLGTSEGVDRSAQ